MGVVTGRDLLRAAARGGKDIRTRYDRGMPDTAHGTLHGAIAASIAAHPAIARLGAAPLPDPHAVTRLVAAFREIAFPGFHPLPRGTDHVDVEAFVAERIPVLRALLVQLVDACLEAVPTTEGVHDAEAIADAALARIPDVRAAIAADVDAAFRGDPAARSREEVVLCYPGVAALAAHRWAHELWRRGVPVLPRMMAEHMHGATGIDIHPGAEIGRGVFIDHGTGVVVGETCRIGDGCRIYQGVTLGAKKFEREADGSLRKGTRRHPTLEANVTVYAGATILGGDTVIGAGSVVAGGVFVTQSVPPGHLVAGPKLQVRVLPTGEDAS